MHPFEYTRGEHALRARSGINTFGISEILNESIQSVVEHKKDYLRTLLE